MSAGKYNSCKLAAFPVIRALQCGDRGKEPHTQHPTTAMKIINIKGKSYEVHSAKPYFHSAGTIGNSKDVQGESLIVRQVRSKKFWLVNRYSDGNYSKLIA